MNLFDYLCGIAEYNAEIPDVEGFLNGVRKKVSVKKLMHLEGGAVHFTCFYRERAIAEEKISLAGGRILKRTYHGLPVFLVRMKKRAGLVAGVLLSALAIAFSSMFVWEIRVEGNEKLSEQIVIEMLKKAGFQEGMMKKNVDVKAVTDRLLINEDEVSWMAINFDGTVAHVEMKEAKLAIPYKKKENVNLVASTNGIILRVDALEGGTKVTKGEAVTKGQLLVSAFVDKRTGGSLLRGARGYVWANTEREFLVEVPLQYCIKQYTGKQEKSFSITFLGVTVDLENPFIKSSEKTECRISEDKLTLFHKIVLPVLVNRTEKSEYTEYKARRSKKEALEMARNTAKDRLCDISPEFVTADMDETYTYEDEKLVYKCIFRGVENIARELEFELS